MSGLADRLARRPRAAAPLAIRARPTARARLFGLGSVFGKSLRDSARAMVAIGVGVGLLVVFTATQVMIEFADEASRRALAATMEVLPPLFRGLLGEPIAIDTLGGFVSWRLLNFLPVLTGAWSVVVLSGTLAREARVGSLEFLATTRYSRRRIALEKVGAHLAAVGMAMLVAGLMTWLSTVAFGTLANDPVSPVAALGHMAWLGLVTLAPGMAAFAVAPLVGRTAAAAVGAIALAGGYIVYGYRDILPALETVGSLSYFSWTAGHRPLAGVTDWPAIALLVALEAALLAVGVLAFERRDIGRTVGIGVSLPRLRLGLGEPFGRSLAERLPAATAWGLGIGVYGFVVAVSAEAFAESLSTIPQIGNIIERFYPGVDYRTAEGVLQLTFFGFGLLLVAVAGATLVGGWAGDEGEGRLELVLATPVSRATWALRSTLGVLVAVGWLGLLAGLTVGFASALQGDAFLTPFVGVLVAALYAGGLAGVGLAAGGLVRSTLAAPVAGGLAAGFYVLSNFGPALGIPDEIVDLALSAHLGQPMSGIYDPVGIAVSGGLAVAGVGLATLGMTRRDVTR